MEVSSGQEAGTGWTGFGERCEVGPTSGSLVHAASSGEEGCWQMV